MRVDVKLTGLDGVLDTLKSLPPELVSKRGGVARSALRKGAMVIVKQARSNFAAAVAQAGKTGITDTTGFTERQIVAKRRRPPSSMKGEKFVVTVNPKPHPNGNIFRNHALQANDIAFVMEAGSSKQAATPWLRPAFESKAEEAIRTVESELLSGVDRAVKKLAAQNKGK